MRLLPFEAGNLRGANVKLEKLATSHCISHIWSTGKSRNGVCKSLGHTRKSVYSHHLSCFNEKCEKEAAFFMANQVMRITLKAYDHQLIDASAKKIIETVKKTERR